MLAQGCASSSIIQSKSPFISIFLTPHPPLDLIVSPRAQDTAYYSHSTAASPDRRCPPGLDARQMTDRMHRTCCTWPVATQAYAPKGILVCQVCSYARHRTRSVPTSTLFGVYFSWYAAALLHAGLVGGLRSCLVREPRALGYGPWRREAGLGLARRAGPGWRGQVPCRVVSSGNGDEMAAHSQRSDEIGPSQHRPHQSILRTAFRLASSSLPATADSPQAIWH